MEKYVVSSIEKFTGNEIATLAGEVNTYLATIPGRCFDVDVKVQPFRGISAEYVVSLSLCAATQTLPRSIEHIVIIADDIEHFVSTVNSYLTNNPAVGAYNYGTPKICVHTHQGRFSLLTALIPYGTNMGSVSQTVRTVTASATLDLVNDEFIQIVAAGVAISLTLPDPAAYPGRTVTVLTKSNTQSQSISVACTDKMILVAHGGAPAGFMSLPYAGDMAQFQSNGVYWYVRNKQTVTKVANDAVRTIAVVATTVMGVVGQGDSVISCSLTGAGDLSITLPDPSLPVNIGRTLTFILAAMTSSGTLTIYSFTPDTGLVDIDGGAHNQADFSAAYERLVLVSNGTKWYATSKTSTVTFSTPV
jgi:hypothetical protein